MVYRTLSERTKPANAVVAPSLHQLPALDAARFNLLVTPFEMSSQAQSYFDGLDLRAVAAHVRMPSGPSLSQEIKIYDVKADQFSNFEVHVAANLPRSPLRDDFIDALKTVALVQRAQMGERAVFNGKICVGSKGYIHTDPETWRSVAQPNTSKNEANTTVFLDDTVHQQATKAPRHLDLADIDPELIYSAAPNSLIFMAGKASYPFRLNRARLHAPSPLSVGATPRFIHLAKNKLG